MKQLLTAIALLIGLSACKDNKLRETDLYFGYAMPGNRQVTEEEWNGFVNRELAHACPEGFTILETKGGWKEKDGRVVIEKGAMVIIVHHADKELDKEIDRLRAAYCRLFRQESVMRVDLAVRDWRL